MNTFQILTLGSGRKLPTRQSLFPRPTRTGRGWGGPCVPAPNPSFLKPPGRSVRLTGSAGSVGAARRVAGATQRPLDRRETPLWGRPTVFVAQPARQPARARARRTFCNPRTSYGDPNGSTLHVAKQVRGIQNPQSCRQAHRISRFPSAPLFQDTVLKQTIEHGLYRILAVV